MSKTTGQCVCGRYDTNEGVMICVGKATPDGQFGGRNKQHEARAKADDDRIAQGSTMIIPTLPAFGQQATGRLGSLSI